MIRQKVIFSLVGVVVTLLIFSSGVLSGYYLPAQLTPIISNAYSKLPFSRQEPTVAFLLEIYGKIKSEYWEDLSDEHLSVYFEQMIKKHHSVNESLVSHDYQGVEKLLSRLIKQMDQNRRKEFVVNVAKDVLANLRPDGRSGLYTQKMETNLKNLVQNINPGKDLYKDIGLEKNAPLEKVQQVAKEMEQKLEEDKRKATTPEAREDIAQKLATIRYAEDVLTIPEKKDKYDTYGIEPTVFTKLISPKVLHIQMKRMSPATFDEFKKAIEGFDKEGGPTGLILDLRGNIGGSLDITTLLLGSFLGPNQVSFDLFRRGKYEPVRTGIDKLPGVVRFKTMVVLVDENGQSSAENLAVVFKRYNLGVVLGKKTKGWGTIEKLYPLKNQIDPNEQYSIFLVNHVTIRDDGLPIEGRGVEPHILIDDPSWDKKLFEDVRRDDLVDDVNKVIKSN